MYHSFDIEHAKKYGVLEAILLQNLGFWILRNIANKKHEHDGFYWTYNSISSFEELFPYVSARKIDIALKHLEDEKVIKTGNFNSAPYDRTKWYAIIDKDVLWSFTAHFTFSTNGFHESAEPIPYINTDRKQIKETERVSTLGELIQYWNTIHNTKYRPIPSLENNFKEALKSYTLDEMKEACKKVAVHPFWSGKMTPTIFLRKRNPEGEPVDWIGTLLSYSTLKKGEYYV